MAWVQVSWPSRQESRKARPIVCHAVVVGKGEILTLPPVPHRRWQVGKAGPGITRIGELTFPGCRTPKSRFCTLPWQHRRADPVDGGGGADDAPLQKCVGYLTPVLVCHMVVGEGVKSSPQACGGWESWPWGHESRGIGTAPHQGSTAELTLWVGVQMSLPRGYESGRAGAKPYVTLVVT